MVTIYGNRVSVKQTGGFKRKRYYEIIQVRTTSEYLNFLVLERSTRKYEELRGNTNE